jgi:hypothetical protein
MNYFPTFVTLLSLSTRVMVFVGANGYHYESDAAASNAASIQQYLSGVDLFSFLLEESINDKVLKSALVATFPKLLSSSISSITASTSLASSSIELVTTLVSSDLSSSSASSFAEAILSGQYNIYLRSFASQYGSTSLLNATCTAAVVNYQNQSSSSSSANSNVGLAVGLTIFCIFMGGICCCVGVWYYRRLRAEILEEKRDGQHFNLTTLGQSSSNVKSDGYTRTFSRHSTLQNIEEAEDPQPSVTMEDDDKNMMWSAPFHDHVENDDDDIVGPIE